MRVIVDVMGGDKAPLEMVKGAAAAAAESQARFILIGDRGQIERVAEEEGIDLSPFEIVHTEEVITMEDEPLSVVRTKKESSMARGLRMLADGEGDAFVSTGNTGALFTGATLIVRKIRGIHRAAIGTLLPMSEPCVLLDTGANVSVTAEDLEQFAVMGSAYIRKMCGVYEPTVGLLNNGTEEGKGTPLQIEANKRLRECPSISYVGNVEGNTVPFGACNVLVTDGFTGNIFIKSIEGVGRLILSSVKEMFLKNGISRLSALMVKGSLSELKHTFDPAEYGGSPFLGISRPVVKAHGSSDARAFQNAILAAIRYAESEVIYDIADEAERFRRVKQETEGRETAPTAGRKGEDDHATT